MTKHKSYRRKRGGVGTPTFGSNPPSSNPPSSNINASLDNVGSNLSTGVKSATDSVKSVLSSFMGNFKKKPEESAPPASAPSVFSSPTTGGKRRMTKKRGGGYKPSMDFNLASSAAPVHGLRTVSANAYVGGKRRHRKSKKTRKSKKNRKH